MKKNILTFGIIIICVGIIFGLRSAVKWRYHSLSAKRVSLRTKGPADAELKIIEFIDFQCPACVQGSKLIRSRVSRYPGRIYFELKYFPLGYKHSLRSAQYAECAARQGKFWAFHDVLVEEQLQWKNLDKKAFEEFFQKIVYDLRLNKKEMDICLEDEGIQDIILQDKKDGEVLGIKATPTYLVNGDIMVGLKSLGHFLMDYFKEKE